MERKRVEHRSRDPGNWTVLARLSSGFWRRHFLPGAQGCLHISEFSPPLIDFPSPQSWSHRGVIVFLSLQGDNPEKIVEHVAENNVLDSAMRAALEARIQKEINKRLKKRWRLLEKLVRMTEREQIHICCAVHVLPTGFWGTGKMLTGSKHSNLFQGWGVAEKDGAAVTDYRGRLRPPVTLDFILKSQLWDQLTGPTHWSQYSANSQKWESFFFYQSGWVTAVMFQVSCFILVYYRKKEPSIWSEPLYIVCWYVVLYCHCSNLFLKDFYFCNIFQQFNVQWNE